ncbi:type II secretion system GspH family protein [Acinetobacter baumannii]|uniref:type II secretion system protein n=1 Tax=Acinetobacter baumannii TaxID=470 RepID=UPI0021BD3458|nr:type II secretion system GspH family protein [Acinetobacter baumannii]MCT9423623.1 type II secretion system GspH family protein [Acinetobacter baumannii]MDC5297552.1 type II secretion system GspH family protein [Acinetobacter baumannii]MDH2566802.1 type II secretion system GspH family protein [Acinetobacter baumannii]MDN8449494.1 type II secretion system GspH family protein [Acinetobacter baumannii]MDO7410201.1 type II secretion system GspH family protein [Acinetobacter baumannii]
MNKKNGFTIVELLVVLAIIALLLSIVVPRYIDKIDESKEIALRQNLSSLRHSIDKFYADKGYYPEKLNDLVEKRYLREVPIDPITGERQWRTIIDLQEGHGIYDVSSFSNNMGSDDKRYSEW